MPENDRYMFGTAWTNWSFWEPNGEGDTPNKCVENHYFKLQSSNTWVANGGPDVTSITSDSGCIGCGNIAAIESFWDAIKPAIQNTPTLIPTTNPINHPTQNPTPHPTDTPIDPTPRPSETPTFLPTIGPSDHPTDNPTSRPTDAPVIPTPLPIGQPTTTPSNRPTAAPVVDVDPNLILVTSDGGSYRYSGEILNVRSDESIIEAYIKDDDSDWLAASDITYRSYNGRWFVEWTSLSGNGISTFDYSIKLVNNLGEEVVAYDIINGIESNDEFDLGSNFGEVKFLLLFVQ